MYYTCHDIPAYHVIDKQVYHMITTCYCQSHGYYNYITLFK